MPSVHLQYWAGARAAAGTDTEQVEAATVREALALVSAGRDAHFARVLAACSLLVDGLAVHETDLDDLLRGPVRVEVLPPFAGGSVQNLDNSLICRYEDWAHRHRRRNVGV